MRTLITMLLLASTLPSWAEPLIIDQAYIPAAPPTAPVLTAYMSLQNPSDSAISVTGFSSDQFKRIEIHESQLQGGVARMHAVESIDIPAGGQAQLKAGGLHLMMFEPITALAVGDSVELTLTFADERQQSVNATVQKRQTHQHHHGHHH